ncbi:MAG: response regulator transcription factor [Cytophagales bacterium]|nr:response regulator transcription factor [Cytophagales bacterium]
MEVLIIEDEPVSAQELEILIKSINSSINVLEVLDTIESSVKYLRINMPDLIFLDIELADGSSFEIFNEIEVSCPIIFTTAYDEHALKAFDQNSIAYLLKPITKPKLEHSFDVLRRMKMAVLKSEVYKQLLHTENRYKESFLVKFGNSLIPLSVPEILYFMSEDNLVFVVNKNFKKYLCSLTLSDLEEVLNPELFFRINRQYIIHKQAVIALKPHVKGQVNINVLSADQLEVVVSRLKTPHLKAWLS